MQNQTQHPKKRFQFTLKVKDCKKEFKKGSGEGVLVTEDVDIFYAMFSDKEREDMGIALQIREYMKEMIDRYIEIEFEEKNED